MMNTIRPNLTMENIIEIDGQYYFHAFLSNSIFRMDNKMEHAEVVERIPWNTSGLNPFPDYGYIYSYKDKLIIVPDLADNICVYDRAKDEIRYIDIPEGKKYQTDFLKGEICGKYLYLIPCDIDFILKVDMENESTTIIRDNCIDGHRNIAWGSICKWNNKIIFTELKSDNVFLLNVDNDTIIKKSTGLNTGLSGIFFADNSFWVAPKKFDELYCLNTDFIIKGCFPVLIDGYESGEWSVHKIICIDDTVYFLPRLANKFLLFNIKDRIFKEICIDERDLNNKLEKYAPISNVWKNDNGIYYIYSRSGKIIRVNDRASVTIPTINTKKSASFGFVTNEKNNGLECLENFINSLII